MHLKEIHHMLINSSFLLKDFWNTFWWETWLCFIFLQVFFTVDLLGSRSHICFCIHCCVVMGLLENPTLLIRAEGAASCKGCLSHLLRTTTFNGTHPHLGWTLIFWEYWGLTKWYKWGFLWNLFDKVEFFFLVLFWRNLEKPFWTFRHFSDKEPQHC